MDTNPMDDDHWWYRLAEKEKMKGKYRWSFFKQPGAVTEYTKQDLPENPEANGFVMSANKWWLTNPNAENKKNLPTGYYEQTLLGKNFASISFTFSEKIHLNVL